MTTSSVAIVETESLSMTEATTQRGLTDRPPLRLVPLPALRPVRAPSRSATAKPQPPRHQRTDDNTAGAMHAWIARYVIAALEITAGCRPPAQVARWSNEDVFETLKRCHRLQTALSQSKGPTLNRGPKTARRGSGVHLRSVHLRPAGPHAVEAVAVVHDGFGHERRGRAVALRVEWDDLEDDEFRRSENRRRPRVVALELG